MAQKYPQSRKWPGKSKLPTCCRSRMGTVKVLYKNKPNTGPGQEAYPCKSGNGYHVRTKRNETE